ncbi:carbon-nitrogen hydrolase family protein [Sphingomonas sp. Sphisp140]|uniref:carbon-nitrogen hydrolase family protein n=1 Tax=unclassified Sphingomonas TaxID=196159 RepID=UPI0039AF6A80
MKASLLQMTSGIDPAANARTITDGVAKAATEGSAMLFTPEMSGLLDGNRERARQHVVAEEQDLVLAATREAAAKHGIWVHLGSLALKGEGGKFLNRGFVIDGTGAIKASYDKLHLFDVDLATGESWRESNTYNRGERAILVDTPIGRLGLAICYDMRFPDLFRALSDAGATALSVPAAFTRPTGQAHWHVLLRARAIEAAAYLIATAQTGEHEDGRATYGHSLVIDPWGEVLLDMGEEAGLGSAEIDLARVEDVRSRVPVLRHRRQIPPVETFA